MRRLLLIAAIAMSPACSKSEPKDGAAEHEAKLPELSIDEVAAGLEAKTLTAYDCNSERTRKRVGILPGAIMVDEETFTAKELPADKAAKLVFYCGGPG